MLRPGITGYATLCADRLRICAAMCKFPLNCCRRRPCALGKSVRPVLAGDETAATAGATGRASGTVAAVAPVADEHRTAAGTTDARAPWRTVAPGTAVAEEPAVAALASVTAHGVCEGVGALSARAAGAAGNPEDAGGAAVAGATPGQSGAGDAVLIGNGGNSGDVGLSGAGTPGLPGNGGLLIGTIGNT